MNAIIQKAIENLLQSVEIQASWEPGQVLDGLLTINFQGCELKWIIEIKQEIRSHQLPAISESNQKYNNYMLVAHKIFPELKKQLRKQNIAYLEASGNLFFNSAEKYVWIDTQKTVPDKKTKGNRAFTRTGLKVLFQFLVDESLLNEPHRTIAEKTGVALGNIPQVLNGLKDTGYLLRLDKKKLIWDKKKELLDRWITEYETTLKPSIFRGRYKFRKDWQEIEFDPKLTLWGGEAAGDLLTQYLRPEEFTIYTRESRADLIRKYHLVPDKNGNVAVYDLFWENEGTQKTAPYVLVYADLISKDNKRCRETAQMILKKGISE